MKTRATKRNAFTLVELLVVIAIIGVLIALLLPAVQAAREAGRRVSCANNLKQIGLAMHTYHDTNLSLPSGYLKRPDGVIGNGWAWGAIVLPFMDQEPLYTEMDLETPYHTATANTQDLTKTVLSVYRCPSDTAPDLNSYLGDIATSNYIGCQGSDSAGSAAPSEPGVLYIESHVRMGNIKDGASNTFMVGERCWGQTYSPFGGPEQPYYKASVWAAKIGGGFVTGFTNTRSMEVLNAKTAFVLNVFSSEHPNGGQFVFADGSVHFINDTIDPTTYKRLGRHSDGQPVGSF